MIYITLVCVLCICTSVWDHRLLFLFYGCVIFREEAIQLLKGRKDGTFLCRPARRPLQTSNEGVHTHSIDIVWALIGVLMWCSCTVNGCDTYHTLILSLYRDNLSTWPGLSVIYEIPCMHLENGIDCSVCRHKFHRLGWVYHTNYILS